MNGERFLGTTAITIAKGIATIPTWGWHSGKRELAGIPVETEIRDDPAPRLNLHFLNGWRVAVVQSCTPAHRDKVHLIIWSGAAARFAIDDVLTAVPGVEALRIVRAVATRPANTALPRHRTSNRPSRLVDRVRQADDVGSLRATPYPRRRDPHHPLQKERTCNGNERQRTR
jgi:hypothetical protein